LTDMDGGAKKRKAERWGGKQGNRKKEGLLLIAYDSKPRISGRKRRGGEKGHAILLPSVLPRKGYWEGGSVLGKFLKKKILSISRLLRISKGCPDIEGGGDERTLLFLLERPRY